ncbi:venom acid phosphatase Acph-1 [Amyelois transitella]|uniref:venom acid phosphatase Acph-1 n=1 Tax=Amyelois transitella TaxID=680683 RepID=UPI00067E05DA|nr:venom acid phosphatase Acph-1 [Amyelois transitella]
MFPIILIVSLAAQYTVSYGGVVGNEVIGDKQLMFAIVVHRHGERTPDADELSLADDKEALENLTLVEGLESLTNVGKRRAYQIGKHIRRRYGFQGLNLISNLYLHDEIAIRSTDKERTKMTVQVAMAAAYPPETEQQWDEAVGKVWQPVPYTTVPLVEDYLRYYSNCKHFRALMAQAKKEALENEFMQYHDLIPRIMWKTGRNFTEDPLWFETLYDLFSSQVGLGLDIPKWAEPILPRLNEAARLAYNLYFRTDEMKTIGGGILLNTFVEAALEISQGRPVKQRLRMFSAHDFNIGALMGAARVENNYNIPEYGAVFALELYKSRSTGKLSVLPVYLPKAGQSSPQTLSFTDCGPYCDFDKFRQLTKEFILSESEYYRICKIRTEL